MSNQNAIDLNSVVVQGEGLVSCDLEGDTALMSVESGKYYGLDPIGSRIWGLIEKPRAVADMCEILQEEFEVERERCEHDVLALLNELAEENLVKVVDDSAA